MVSVMTSLLSTRALLVRPSISVWHGEITDRTAAAEVAQHFSAERGSVKTLKLLVPKAAIDPIQTAASAIRSFVRRETLPWRWDGVSLLPTDNYMHFTDGWRQHKAEFDGAVATLLRSWHLHVLAGQRSLGTLARIYEWPDREDVARRFAASVEVFSVPDAADFRASLSESEAAIIQSDMQDRADAQLREAQSYLWQEMQSHVSHVVERLTAYGTDPATGKMVGRFHDTLIGNMRLLCDRLSRLNITADPEIETMRRELEAKLCPYEAQDLRDSEPLRTSVRDEAARIMEQMSQLYSLPAAAE